MSSPHSIREILLAELEAATLAQHRATDAFSQVMKEIPSGLPHSDGLLWMKAVTRDCSRTMDDYIRALRDYNDYLLFRTVPDRLKNGPDVPAGSGTT